jgi:hypothetical protein
MYYYNYLKRLGMAEYRGQSVNWQFFKLLKFVLEFVQYEAAKIVTGAMKGTSRHSLMQEIGWEDMKLGVLSTS